MEAPKVNAVPTIALTPSLSTPRMSGVRIVLSWIGLSLLAFPIAGYPGTSTATHGFQGPDLADQRPRGHPSATQPTSCPPPTRTCKCAAGEFQVVQQVLGGSRDRRDHEACGTRCVTNADHGHMNFTEPRHPRAPSSTTRRSLFRTGALNCRSL